MATKRQIEEQDRQSEQRRAEAVAEIVRHGHHPDGAIGGDVDIAAGVLDATIKALCGEADDVETLRRKGWQGEAKSYRAAAGILSGWHGRVLAYTPPAGPPRPLDAIPVSNRSATVADLDARLSNAFGPELAPIRHIRTVLEDATDPDASGTVQTTHGALCGSATGSWTHPGGANCEDCHARYAEENGGPYTGPTAFNGGDPEPIDAGQPPCNAQAEHRPHDGCPGSGRFRVDSSWDGATCGEQCMHTDHPAPRRDEPITPSVATAIREEIEATQIDPFERIRRESVAMIDETLAARLADEQAKGVDADPQYAVGDKVTVGGVEFTKHSEFPPLPIVEPSGPVRRPRMTPQQVREHGVARARGAHHRSVSQVTGYADCGTRYALSDLEPPAWYNVGGKALHRVVEEINRHIAAGDDIDVYTDRAAGAFGNAFEVEIGETFQHNTTPMSQWRIGNRGKENYDWWRVEGPGMVARYVEWLRGRLSDGWEIARTAGVPIQQQPVIEFECRLNVGAMVPNLSIVDMALIHPAHNLLEVVDVKAGASAPKDTFQLGVYGWCLLSVGVAGFTPAADLSNVRGRYWRARTGVCVPDESNAGWPVLQMHGWDSVVHRCREQDSMERQGFYQPNVTSCCGGCGVKDLCPAQTDQ